MPTSFAQVAGGGPRKFFVEERSRIFVVKYVDLPSDKTKVDNHAIVEKNLAEKSRRSIVALVLLLRHTRLPLSRYNIDIYKVD